MTLSFYRVIGLVGSLFHDGSVCVLKINMDTSIGRRVLIVGLEIGGFVVAFPVALHCFSRRWTITRITKQCQILWNSATARALYSACHQHACSLGGPYSFR
jgi:hypothetical protein